MSGPDHWHRIANPNASSVNWVAGQGHVPLDQARRVAVEQVEIAEAELIKADEVFDKYAAELKKAKAARDLAYNKRQEARLRFKAARESLMRRFPEPPEEPS